MYPYELFTKTAQGDYDSWGVTCKTFEVAVDIARECTTKNMRRFYVFFEKNPLGFVEIDGRYYSMEVR